MVSLLVKASTSGKMEVFTLVNFKMVLSTVKENGVSVSMRRTVTCTKVTMPMTRRTAWVSLSGSQATTTRDVTKMMRDMATERCTGRTGPVTRESGSMEFKMELAAWSSLMAE